MVLGFGTKSTKKKGADSGGVNEHGLRQSPSLPQMTAQGVAWPSNLVDVASIRDSPPQTPQTYAAGGATKVSFAYAENGIPPFHRPFRISQSRERSASGTAVGTGLRSEGGRNGAGPIASLYMSTHPPSAFGGKQERASTPQSSRTVRRGHSQRKRAAPTFNLMVVGAQGTGKVRIWLL
jgi:hypothetical protein